MTKKPHLIWKLEDLLIKANRIEYKINNQLSSNAFLLYLVETELDIFGKVLEGTRKMIRSR